MAKTTNDLKIAVRRTFDCSTVHITAEDRDLLNVSSLASLPHLDDISNVTEGMWNAASNYPGIVYGHETGWFVYTGSSDEDGYQSRLRRMRAVGYSDAMIDLMVIARSNDCVFIALDRDGHTYDELPQFDW